MKHHSKLQDLLSQGIQDVVVRGWCRAAAKTPVHFTPISRREMTEHLYNNGQQSFYFFITNPFGVEDDQRAVYVHPVKDNEYKIIMFTNQEREGEECFAEVTTGSIFHYKESLVVTNSASYSFVSGMTNKLMDVYEPWIASDIINNFYVVLGHLRCDFPPQKSH